MSSKSEYFVGWLGRYADHLASFGDGDGLVGAIRAHLIEHNQLNQALNDLLDAGSRACLAPGVEIFSILTAAGDRARAAITGKVCRTCSECDDTDHHWMWLGRALVLGGPVDEAECQVMECKHCDAIRRMGDDEDPG